MRLHDFNPLTGELGDATGFSWSTTSRGEWSGIFWVQPPFSPPFGASPTPAGTVLTFSSPDYEFEISSRDGEEQSRFAVAAERVPVDQRLKDQWEESRGCQPGQPECDRRRTELAISLGWPEHLPPIGRHEIYADGSFALLRSDLDPNPFESGDVATWDFFSRDGRFFGRLEHAVRPFWFGDGLLIGTERDELGVEQVVQYQVTLPSGEG